MKSPLFPLALGLLLSGALRADARPRLDGPAIVVGFHILPAAPGELLEIPRSPVELVNRAPASGEWDVWLVVLTRAPLIGAWTLNVALDYDAEPGRGLDILGWENMADVARPRPEWPAAGAGNGCEFLWPREGRCFTPRTGLVAGSDGWWLQVAARIRVVAHGSDRLALADPEPGVRPQEVECQDEYHPLDGTDNWTGVVPALFGDGVPVTSLLPRLLPVRSLRWSELKLRSAP